MKTTTLIATTLICCAASFMQAQSEASKVSTMTIGMTSVYVDSPAKAFKFYTDTLGLVEVMFMPEAEIAIVASPLDPDGTTLLLEPNGNPIAREYQEKVRAAGFPMMIFFTDDIQKEYTRLMKLGVKFTGEPTETDYGIQTNFDDNCGNWIQLYQRKK